MLALPLAIVGLIQTIWIVDANNGPGTNFTDLPAAVAAATSGDTILVQSGAYSAFNVSGKSLTIRGAASAATIIGMPAPAGSSSLQIRIDNVPIGGPFRLSGMTINAPQLASWATQPVSMLQISGAATIVVLTDLVVEGVWMVGWPGTTAFRVSGGATVHAARCSFMGGLSPDWSGGGGGFVAPGSRLAADACTFTGRNAAPVTNASGGTALWVDSALATLTRCSMYAGYGDFGGRGLMSAYTAFVRVAGTSADTIWGAAAGSGTYFYGPAISAGINASAIVHGNVTIGHPVPSFPPVSGPVTLGAPPLPYLSITGSITPAGEMLAAQPVTANFEALFPGAPFACLVDLVPTFSTQFAPLALGELLVPLSATILEGTTDALGMVTTTVSVPWLAGVSIHAQFGVLDGGANQVRLSNELIRIFN